MALPGTKELEHFGSPSFRVNGKIFAQLSAQDSAEHRALVKLSPADQAALTMMEPGTFVPAPHWGRHGWTYISLKTVEEEVFRDVLLRSWKLISRKSPTTNAVASKRGSGKKAQSPKP